MPRGRVRQPYYIRPSFAFAPPTSDAVGGAMCGVDPVADVPVHRFDIGTRVCRCKQVDLQQAHADLPLSVHEKLHR